ncbi:MAG: hypothetical protein M3179_15230 [Actinomycetota bacterium]|nr:hypothetical protein [Actinomycetota bacterium]
MQVKEATDWAQAKRALAEAVLKVTDLLKSVRDPNRPALGQWSIAELAMHLSQAWIAVPALARQDLTALRDYVPGLAPTAQSLIRDLWELECTTKAAVTSDPERDLTVLADRIAARAAEFLQESEAHMALDPRPWLVEGTRVPLAVLTGHLLNETLVHGYDIAKAAARPWRIDPAHAAMVVDGFLIPVVRSLPPRTMTHPERAAGVRATFDLRLRGGGRTFWIFDDGELHIEEPSDRPVDCHISADPTAFLLVAWARKSQWSAIAKGQLMAWGRKPWLGLRFRPLMRNP